MIENLKLFTGINNMRIKQKVCNNVLLMACLFTIGILFLKKPILWKFLYLLFCDQSICSIAKPTPKLGMKRCKLYWSFSQKKWHKILFILPLFPPDSLNILTFIYFPQLMPCTFSGLFHLLRLWLP
jgi:hypothetical protein